MALTRISAPEDAKMALTYVKSAKGSNQLLHKGHLYTRNRERNGRTYWKCIKYTSGKCPGTCQTEAGVAYEGGKEHNHVPGPADVQKRKLISEFKECARESLGTPQELVASLSRELPMSVMAVLPAASLMKRTAQRARQAVSTLPPAPPNLAEMVVPEQLAMVNEEQFLLFDSGQGSDRILVFGMRSAMDLLVRSDHWYADGTFKTAPPLFEQLCVVHAVRHSGIVPAAYILLPDKQRRTYARALEALQRVKPGLNPAIVTVDFDKARAAAFTDVFPEAAIRGCFFHFSQCLWRVVTSCGDLRDRYADPEDPDFSLNVRKLAALAFVPVADVVSIFEELLNTPFYLEKDEILAPLVNVFEDAWIGRLRSNGTRREPAFPLRFWNCHETILAGLPDVGDSIEAWHRAFCAATSACHSNVWKFVEALRREQNSNEPRIREGLAGTTHPVTKKKRNAAENMKRIVEAYGQKGDVGAYLGTIAHHFDLRVEVA